MPGRWWRLLPMIPGVVGALAACAGPSRTELVDRPLLDGLHEPEVLVERSALELPPSLGPQRFLEGWLPWPGNRGLAALVPRPEGASVELVQLQDRRRHLILRLQQERGDWDRRLEVAAAGETLAELPLAERLRVPLPAGRGVGRVRLELGFSDTRELGVTRARVHPVLPEGEVRFLDGSIVQSPWSAIDFVQDLPGGAVLLGSFQPPRSVGADQSFRVTLTTESGGETELFAWSEGGPAEIRAELPAEPGLGRLRLWATGEGEAARWSSLRVAEPAVRRPEPTPPPEPPKLVILYLLDALRADYVGHLGGPEGISPTLDRLAAEGVTFTRHISNAPNTKPSIKSLFIGRHFLLRGHESLPLDGPPTLAESFASAGYRTVALSASPWVSASFGTDRGFEFRSVRAEYRPETAAGYNDSAERVHGVAHEALDSFDSDERAFLYMHTMHPHNPYDPPPELRERFVDGIDSSIDGSTPTLIGLRNGRLEASPADRERLRALYAAGLAYNDAELARFFERIERDYAPGDVLAIFTSDHGEELFDHEGVLHGYTLHRHQLEIPLIFWWPGVLEPRRIDTMTDHLDLSATLRELVDPETPGGAGRSLWDLLLGAPPREPRQVRFAAASSLPGGIFMAESEDLKLIWAPRVGTGFGMGIGRGRDHDATSLFDLRLDPGERQNRAGEGGLEEAWLRARLRAWIERGKLEEVGSDLEEQVDEETRNRLRALGYVD